jgi:hypothetical protein
MNVAEILQHRPQQMLSGRIFGSGLNRRKFRCVFKDSSGK